MKVARYMGGGQIAIVGEPEPTCPEGGLLVRTEASGLCSGELMDWYMDRKIPHVLGHEVAGIVVESQDSRFPVGCRVAPHHHAPCMTCDLCQRGAYVHCEQWKRTKLVPGGMAEYFAVGPENLTDCYSTALRPRDAALLEPLACVSKSITRSGIDSHPRANIATIGLGVMGLLHKLAMRHFAHDWVRQPSMIAYDLNESRREWAKRIGIDARLPENFVPAEVVFVCPGTEKALELAFQIASPDATIVLFSPIGPPGVLTVPFDELYFRDITLVSSYSCGPSDTKVALRILEADSVKAEQVVSHFISIDELPDAYQAMKRGEILKPMVLFEA